MNPGMLTNPRMLVVVGAAMIALAGCDGGGSNSDPGDQTSPSAAAIGNTALELAQCMRANGEPGFPDPVQDESGDWIFPETDVNYKVPAVCKGRGRAQKDSQKADAEQHTAAEDMAKRRQYASCMREHGMPDFPDPDNDGNFPLSDRLRALNDAPAMRDARQACKEYEPPRVVKPSRSAAPS
ncbi:hypothetical protein ACFP2T_08140 [Plantactinospora solaniradicis]|uniref:Phospholipase n=1 Tax=Plantactinospora solaniradicis TaxID=1723736 RepID=A0ABW1K798_9ACTN